MIYQVFLVILANWTKWGTELGKFRRYIGIFYWYRWHDVAGGRLGGIFYYLPKADACQAVGSK